MKNTIAFALLTLMISAQAFAQAGLTTNSVDSRPGTSAPDSMPLPTKPKSAQGTIQTLDHGPVDMTDAGDVTHIKKTKTSKKTTNTKTDAMPDASPSN